MAESNPMAVLTQQVSVIRLATILKAWPFGSTAAFPLSSTTDQSDRIPLMLS